MLPIARVEDDRGVAVLLNVPFVDHLGQELRSSLPLVGLVLQHADASSKRFQLLHILGYLLLLLDLFLLVLFDLMLGPAPLAANLHEVGGDALRNCEH